MKTLTHAAVIILCASSVGWADELILKDGKAIPFKSITDAGDNVEVVTDKGDKLQVKKTNIERVAFGHGIPGGPLTGATFTFDKKVKLTTIDLLAGVDPKTALAGTWKIQGGSLTGTANGGTAGKIQLAAPPEEYDITMTVVRLEGEGEIGIGLVAGGKQFELCFDAVKSSWSGLWWLDGKGAEANGTGIPGKFFEKKVPKAITIMVRKDGLAVRVDNKDFLVNRVDWSKASIWPDHAVQSKNSLFLTACYYSTFAISKMTLSAPKAEGQKP